MLSEAELLQTAIMQARSALVITDADADKGYAVLIANPAFCEMTGYTLDELKGQSLKRLQGPDTDPAVIDHLRTCLRERRYFEGATVNYRKDGTPYVVRWNASPVFNEAGVLTHFLSIQQDISEQVRREQSLRKAASVDKLTGLYNRNYGEQILRKLHQDSIENDQPLTVIVADIDFFKTINDCYGHSAGDRVLKQVAKTLSNTIRARDTVIRWGGEEFLMVLADCAPSPGLALAERIRLSVAQQQDVDVAQVTLSLGVATLRADETVGALIDRADQALYQAKQAGRNRVSVSPD